MSAHGSSGSHSAISKREWGDARGMMADFFVGLAARAHQVLHVFQVQIALLAANHQMSLAGHPHHC